MLRIYTNLKAERKIKPDSYLDQLLRVSESGFLREYVWFYFQNLHWPGRPMGLRLYEFNEWRLKNLPNHREVTLANIEIEDSKTAK